jgi:hypothetical protein
MNRMHSVVALGAIFATCLVACASDPHSLRITEENKDSFMEQLKDSKGLTLEEMGLLTASQMRRAAAKALGGTEPIFVGKTIGEVIADEKKWRDEQKKKEEEEKRLAAEAKAKEDALAAQLREAVSLTVFDKGFVPSNPSAGRFDDYITVKTAYENKSGKDIRAFRGVVRFTDLFDKQIYATAITIDDPLPAGQKGTWNGVIDYNQFDDDDRALRNAEMQNMKIVWQPRSILFADGSALGESSGTSGK